MLQVWLRYLDQHSNLLCTHSNCLSEPVPNSSSLTGKKLMKIQAALKKNVLSSRSVLAMTDKVWVKKRLCKCFKGRKEVCLI